MWPKRKRGNRRSDEREQLLEVKLRTDQVQAARAHVAGVGMAIVLIVAAVAVVGWFGGRYMLDRFIYKNAAFAVTQIEVQSDGIATLDAIRNWANVKTGENLLALDLLKIKRDLEMQPSIDAVAVERLLPHTLKLRVTEREAIAQTVVTLPRPDGNYEQVIYHFDEAGYAMKPLDPKLMVQQPVSTDHLPLLLGVQVSELQSGRQVESAQIRAALRLLGEFDRSPMTGLAELQRINVSMPEVLEVTTSQNAVITFGLNNFEMQLRRWRLVYDQYQKWGKAIATLDLSVANNLPVTCVAAAGVQPLPPKATKPPRTKRKHV